MKIKDILLSDEKVECTSTSSKVPFFIVLTVAVIIAIVGAILMATSHYTSGTFALGIILEVIAIAVAIFSLTKLEYILSTKITITDKRIILLSGFINTVHSEIPIDKVSGITISEPLLGKIFHYGTIIIESSASVSGVRAKYIDKPFEFKNKIPSNNTV